MNNTEPAAQGMVTILLSPQMLRDLQFCNQKWKVDGEPVFSQRSAISTAEVILKRPGQARGHFPSSVGNPKGGVSGREWVTWKWDPTSPEGSNLPVKSLQLLPTHPVRALPLVSSQLTETRGEQGPAFLPQLSFPTPSSVPSSGGCHGQAGRSRTASHLLLGLVKIPTGFLQERTRC